MRFLLLLCVAIYAHSFDISRASSEMDPSPCLFFSISGILPNIDPNPYSFEDKVDILKKIGLEYCVSNEGNENPSHRTFSMESYWMVYFINKLGLTKGGAFFAKPIGEDGFEDFKNFTTNFREFYRNETPLVIGPEIYHCLVVYDSQKYHDEVVRIVKKYCKDCK